MNEETRKAAEQLAGNIGPAQLAALQIMITFLLTPLIEQLDTLNGCMERIAHVVENPR